MKQYLALTIALCLFSLTITAQTKSVEIPDGAELSVVTTETLSSKTATEGDPVTFKVDEDFKVNDVIVISKGTIVKGFVSNAEKNGHFGKAGKLNVRIESTKY